MVKERVGAEVRVNTDLVMLCYKTITSTSNTLKNLVINSNYHSSYSTQEFNTKKEQMSTIFNTYVTPQIKEINHPEFLQEWKLNIDAAEYERNMAENYRPSEKKKINRHADHDHWPASIKSTCQWFPFHAIMEYTGNIMQDDTHLMSSLLKMFSMFEIRLSYGDKYLDTLCLKCINCKKETGLNSETNFTWVYDKVITKFVLNAMLHHVCM